MIFCSSPVSLICFRPSALYDHGRVTATLEHFGENILG